MSGNSMSIIAIHSLRQALKLGCSSEERSFPQLIEFEIEMTLDTVRAAATDSLEDTVDYISVIRLIEKHTDGREWQLLEKLCSDLATLILEAESKLAAVTINARKRITANSAGFSARVTVAR